MRILGRLTFGLLAIFAVLVAVVLIRTFTFRGRRRPPIPPSVKVLRRLWPSMWPGGRPAPVAGGADPDGQPSGPRRRPARRMDPAARLPGRGLPRRSRRHDPRDRRDEHAGLHLEGRRSILLAPSDPDGPPGRGAGDRRETERDWRHPPFAGVIAEGAVWGRGSIDDKGCLINLVFEGVEVPGEAGLQAPAHGDGRLRRGRGGRRDRRRARRGASSSSARDQGRSSWSTRAWR